jgi:Repeat of unknown function (DUF5907)
VPFGVAPAAPPASIDPGDLPDADASTKGAVQLAGDLSGTAAAPTVPGLASKQAADADLTTIAGLSPLNDDIVQRKSGAWTNRTPSQLRTDMGLTTEQIRELTTAQAYFKPTGVLRETYSRAASSGENGSVLTSGQGRGTAIVLFAGDVINSITCYSGTTAAGTPTNQWFALTDSSFNTLRVTSDDTTTAWAASAPKTLNLSSSYTVPTTGVYYVVCVVVATTVPTVIRAYTPTTATPSYIGALTPMVGFGGDSGLTNPASAPATWTATGSLTRLYATVA